jgi:hypothetical protein
MNDFSASLHLPGPLPDWDEALQALWWDARGEWERAHALAQINEGDPRSAWVHAYLHRKEGDLSNAAYWRRSCTKSEQYLQRINPDRVHRGAQETSSAA